MRYDIDYLGQTYKLVQGNISEYIVDTTPGISGDFGMYVMDNNIPIKKYCYVKKNNQTGAILLIKMSDTLDDSIKERNKDKINGKNLAKFKYKGQKQSLQQGLEKWQKGQDFDTTGTTPEE